MQCNAAGIELIKIFEGFRETAYQDQNGRWTIGYGCAQSFVCEGMTCTDLQAAQWLAQDVQNVAAALTRLIKVPVNENQFAALCSLAYNIGTGNFSNSSTLGVLNQNDFVDVPIRIQLWNRAAGKIDPGLVRRRAAEVELWNLPI